MEFRCQDPNALVLAANVRATLDAFQLVPWAGRRLIERHKLELSDLNAYVPVQRWLDTLRDIQNEVGPISLRNVGISVIDKAPLPPHFTTVEMVLEALDMIYYSYHRGDVGHYRVDSSRQGVITIHCETPYPKNFEWGIVEGICSTPRFESGRYEVDFIDGEPRALRTCTLVVRKLDTAQPSR